MAGLYFFTYITQLVKLSKFHQSLGNSSDVQIQTCTSILFLSWVFICTRNGNVGVQKRPILPWDAAGKGALGMTLEGPQPSKCLCTNVNYVIMK